MENLSKYVRLISASVEDQEADKLYRKFIDTADWKDANKLMSSNYPGYNSAQSKPATKFIFDAFKKWLKSQDYKEIKEELMRKVKDKIYAGIT